MYCIAHLLRLVMLLLGGRCHHLLSLRHPILQYLLLLLLCALPVCLVKLLLQQVGLGQHIHPGLGGEATLQLIPAMRHGVDRGQTGQQHLSCA